jgi:hypothetical protein
MWSSRIDARFFSRCNKNHKALSVQRSGAEILFLTLTQILNVVVVGALVSRLGYYVSSQRTISQFLDWALTDAIHYVGYRAERCRICVAYFTGIN